MESRFWHFDATFDAVATVRKFEDHQRGTRPGHHVNYFGVAIDTKFFPQILTEGVEGDPVPANWHADLSEFAAALRAVDLAAETFTMAELGCGWGCWMSITGMAARRSGRKVLLKGVEGDPNHLGFAREAMATNGFGANEFELHHGIAAANGGTALFPTQHGNNWGLAPRFGVDEATRAAAVAGGEWEDLPMVALSALAGPGERLDLLHLDIQGGEADLVEAALPFLQDHVAYMMIGTHSRAIEGRLFECLTLSGWKLEIDRPATYHLHLDPPLVCVDGVQGWRNRRLLPE
jgi:hypothetical protein